MKLNIGDKVYKFYNGRYQSGICVVVEADENGYGIIPTDCTINGVVPTKENTKPERFPKEGFVTAIGIGNISIHKATPELKEKIDKYNTRMLLVNKICEALGVGERSKKAVSDGLLTRTTKQLFAILLILYVNADGKRGTCAINSEGKLEYDFFVEEELVNYVEEP